MTYQDDESNCGEDGTRCACDSGLQHSACSSTECCNNSHWMAYPYNSETPTVTCDVLSCCSLEYFSSNETMLLADQVTHQNMCTGVMPPPGTELHTESEY